MPEWTKGFIRSIKPAVEKEAIETGDKLHVTLEGASFSPIVLVRLSPDLDNPVRCNQLVLNQHRRTRPKNSSGEEVSLALFMVTTLSVSSRAQRLIRLLSRIRRRFLALLHVL